MKYLFLKHYRGGRMPEGFVPMEHWTQAEFDAHVKYMLDFQDKLRDTGEFVSGEAVAPDGVWVQSGGEGKPPVVDGPFAETKDLIAGWMVVDVDSEQRAYELAGELSAAPGKDGHPINEWLEVRPFLSVPPTIAD